MHRYSLVILFCITSFFCYSQTTKKVEGTVSIGCKVFNYTFTENSHSLYSFYLEDIEKEGAIIPFDKEKISTLKISCEKYIAKLKEATSGRSARTDSLDSIVKLHITLADVIIDDKSTLLYWQTNRDNIKSLIGESRKLTLGKELSESVADTIFSPYLDTLEKRTAQVVDLFKSKTYALNGFNQQSFVNLVENLIKRYQIFFLPECAKQAQSEDIANALFFDIRARLDFADDQPLTAKLKLKNYRVNVYYTPYSYNNLLRKHQKILLTQMSVKDVTAEFEDGTIKNLLADLVFDKDSSASSINLPSRFKNIVPITVSGRSDPDKFGKTRLYLGNPSDFLYRVNASGAAVDNLIFKEFNYKKYNRNAAFYSIDTTTTKYKEKRDERREDILDKGEVFIVLSELLDYLIEPENDNEDYSPANMVVHLNKSTLSQDLKKEPRSRILSVKSYTDFVGMQGDQPNGLIQIEASRKFNLHTYRGGTGGIYLGAFTYLEPVFTISKIEKDRNAIPLSIANIDSSALKNGRKVMHVRTIDLLKYQNSTFDLNLNLGKYNIPSIKSNLQLNASAGLIRTNISDSVTVSGTAAIKSEAPLEKTLTSYRWGITVLYELKPDSRYGFMLGWDLRKISLLSRDYLIPTIPNPVTNTFWADAYLKTNGHNKLFFRYRITYLNAHSYDNFVQIQLGYLLDIFKNNSK